LTFESRAQAAGGWRADPDYQARTILPKLSLPAM
jgi:hypothetical protein